MSTNKKKLEELSASYSTALDMIQEIIDQAGDGLTEEQDKNVEALQIEADSLAAQIEDVKAEQAKHAKRLEDLAKARERQNALASGSGPKGILLPGQPTDQRSSGIPAQARKHSRLRAFSGDQYGMAPEERAYRFGQFALAKLRNDMPQYFGGRFQNSVDFCREQWGLNLGGFQAASHGEGGSDTSGAHVFVPEEFGMDLIKLREQYGVARGLCQIVPMASDTKTQPKRTGGLTAYAVGENAAGTESQASYEDVRLTARKWMVIARMSSELGEDAAINFGDELADEISYAFANKEDDCVFNGDGTSTYHGILGIRNRLDTLTAGTDPGLILGDGNAWSEQTLANHEEVLGALPHYADGPGAVWVCHKTYYYTVMVRLALAAGGATSTEIVNGRRVPVFLGYPVVFSQVFPSVEGNSQIPVIFGNIALGAMFGDRRAETIQFTDTAVVNSESLWERDQIGVRGTERFDVAVHGYGSSAAAGPIVGLETASS